MNPDGILKTIEFVLGTIMLATIGGGFDDKGIWRTSSPFSFNLGNLTAVSDDNKDYEEMLRHELGHREQYNDLGWLYYPGVAIPSAARAWWALVKRMPHDEYMSGYPEKWATGLGNKVDITKFLGER